MRKNLKLLVVPGLLAAVLAAGALAATTSVTITSLASNISLKKHPTMAVGGSVKFAAATAGGTKFYLRRDGCGTSSDNPHLSTVSGDDAGTGCGFVGGSGFVSTASPSLFSVDYPSTNGMPLSLDSSRPATGVLDLNNGTGGAGQVTLDFTLEALVNGNGVIVGTDTETVLVDPTTADYPVPFQIALNSSLNRADVSGLDLNVYIHGAYAESGYIGNSGASYLTVPSYSASVNRSLLLSVDDPTFSSPVSATLDSSVANWNAVLPTPAVGKHTVYAKSSQGFESSSVVSRGFTVTK